MTAHLTVTDTVARADRRVIVPNHTPEDTRD
jgi:hypothetical protein